MLNAQFRPLTPEHKAFKPQYRRSPFKSSWPSTLDLLEAELRYLSAKDVVVEIALELRDIRNDGWPRADARPTSPIVVLSFASSKGNLSYPCASYGDWRSNLRAIALSLQALRAVDRYGVTRSNEQYRGWSQIDAPRTGKMTPADAAQVISAHSGVCPEELLRSEADFLAAYRMAISKVHPDREGGDHDAAAMVNTARDVLQEVFDA